MNPVHTLSVFYKTQYYHNFYTHFFQVVSSFQVFQLQFCAHFSYLHMCYMPRPSHSSSFIIGLITCELYVPCPTHFSRPTSNVSQYLGPLKLKMFIASSNFTCIQGFATGYNSKVPHKKDISVTGTIIQIPNCRCHITVRVTFAGVMLHFLVPLPNI